MAFSCFILKMFFIKLYPDDADKRNYNNNCENDSKICHLSISFPSNIKAIINGNTVAKMPKVTTQNLSPEGLAICAITKAEIDLRNVIKELGCAILLFISSY